jgi:hypothetical protein
MLSGRAEERLRPEPLHEATKLTVYVGRQERAAGRPAHEAVVALLHRRGIARTSATAAYDSPAASEPRAPSRSTTYSRCGRP